MDVGQLMLMQMRSTFQTAVAQQNYQFSYKQLRALSFVTLKHLLATTNISEPFRITFLLGRFPSVIYKSHIHYVDKSSAELFPSIDGQLFTEMVRLNSSHLLAQLIGQDGQLHLPQFVYESTESFPASLVTKTPALKEGSSIMTLLENFFVFAQKL